MSDYLFKDPLWFIALAVLPLLFWLRSCRSARVSLVPFAAAWHRQSLRRLSRWPMVLAGAGLVLIITALARPQHVDQRRQEHAKGYDIMLAIDLSGSMLTEDYTAHGQRINRLQAIKPVIRAFIEDRPSDRIGIVVFSGRAYTLSPLTFDHAWLAEQTARLKIGLIEDGTAIGDGLGLALTRLDQAGRMADGRRLGAFVILLTDGANNRGALSPDQAAKIAKSRGIPVYTIGAGRSGIVPYPVFDQQGRQIGTQPMVSDLDENTLADIASMTGGHYYRADDSDTIKSAFAAIDRVKKIDFQRQSHLLTSELFYWPGAAGVVALTAGFLLDRRRHREVFA